MHHVISGLSIEPGWRLRLTYSEGTTVSVELARMIQQGGVFAALADQEFFSQVAIGEGGRFIEWPGGIDLCADALWLEGMNSDHDKVALSVSDHM